MQVGDLVLIKIPNPQTPLDKMINDANGEIVDASRFTIKGDEFAVRITTGAIVMVKKAHLLRRPIIIV